MFSNLLLTAMVSLSIAAPPSKADPKILRIGIVASVSEGKSPRLGEVFAPELSDIVKEYTGLRSVVLNGLDPFTSARQLENGKWQLGVFPGVQFTWVQKNYPHLKPLMVLINQKTALRAVLVARKGSSIKGFADLKGKEIAILEGKLHCRLFADRSVPDHQHRNTFAKFFQSTNGHDAIEDVLTGKVKAAIVDTPSLELYKDLYPGRFKRLTILAKSPPFPPSVVVYRDGALRPELLKRFQAGMLKVNQSTKGRVELETFGILRFQAVPKDFQKTLAEIAKAYPPPGQPDR
jgi:ABC-type phosphate/phosphonate transport system substrate-binding protein